MNHRGDPDLILDRSFEARPGDGPCACVHARGRLFGSRPYRGL